MNFYHKEFKSFRKKQRYTAIEFCKVMKITRTTLWEWESGKRMPSEANIRRMAEILNISTEQISNIKYDQDKTSTDFGKPENAVRSLFNKNEEAKEDKFAAIIREIVNLKTELEQASIIIKALLTTMHTMFYIKDAGLKYVIANNNFLANLSLQNDYLVKGKTDKDFFPASEALYNSRQDKEVILSKKPIITVEKYIPGTRKKKWGLISKIPIIDRKNNAVGIVGTFLDITERKKQNEIRRLLEIALNSSSYVVWLLRPYPRYKLLYVSKSVYELYGYNSEKFLKTKDFWFNHCVHIQDKKKLEPYWLSGKISELPEKRIFKIICSDGKEKLVESTLVNTKINESVAYIEREIYENPYKIEYKTKRIIAKKMLLEGIDRKIINKITGISLEE